MLSHERPTRGRCPVFLSRNSGTTRYRSDQKRGRHRSCGDHNWSKPGSNRLLVGDGAKVAFRHADQRGEQDLPLRSEQRPHSRPLNKVCRGRQTLRARPRLWPLGAVDWSFLAPAVWNLVAAMARHARTLPANVARHLSRARILDAVLHDPGKNLARICDELALNRGTASYHLYILERAGAISSLATTRDRHYFLPNVAPELRPALATLRRERALEVALALLEAPGLEQRELLSRIGMDRKVWKPYRLELSRQGLLIEERHGRRIRYRATPRLEHLVETLQTSVRERSREGRVR